MSNDLSKQLCELCGIKPRYGIYVDYGDLDHNYKLETNERKYRLIADYRWHYSVDDEDLKDLKPEFYPDFTKPENFVKLLEILSNYMYDDDRGISITKNTVILGDPICLGTDESEKELNILQKVLKLLLDGLNEGFESDKKFKQSIREAEWVYD